MTVFRKKKKHDILWAQVYSHTPENWNPIQKAILETIWAWIQSGQGWNSTRNDFEDDSAIFFSVHSIRLEPSIWNELENPHQTPAYVVSARAEAASYFQGCYWSKMLHNFFKLNKKQNRKWALLLKIQLRKTHRCSYF